MVRRTETEVPKNGLNIAYYSHKQVCDLLDTKDETLKKYRLYVGVSHCGPLRRY